MSTENKANLDGNPRGRWRRPIFWLLMAVIVFGGGYVFCFYTPPLHVSKATTYITEPLLPDGRVDYFKAFEKKAYSPLMATDDNGYRLFVQRFGDVASETDMAGNPDKGFYIAQKARKLGLDPQMLPSVNFPVDPQGAILKVDYDKIKLISKPWTLDDLPELADWIREAETPLNELADMLRKPIFQAPYLESPQAAQGNGPQDLLTLLLPDVQFYRNLARIYQARANYRIASGNIGGAIDDQISVLNLARKFALHDGVLIELLVGIAIEGVGLNLAIAENPDHQPTMEQLKRFQKAFDDLPEFTPLENCYETERFYALSTLQDVVHGIKNDDINDVLFWGARLSDPNILFRETNIAYDMLTGKLPRDNFYEYIAPPELNVKFFLDLLTVPSRSKITAKTFRALFMPALEAVEEATRRNRCSGNLKRLQIALLMYKAENGDWPGEDWVEKIKPYLRKDSESDWRQYFRCPSNRHEGETHYALILYDNHPKTLDTALLVELLHPVDFDKATITPEQFLRSAAGSLHTGGFNVAYQDGLIVFTSNSISAKERQRIVGIETPETDKNEDGDAHDSGNPSP